MESGEVDVAELSQACAPAGDVAAVGVNQLCAEGLKEAGAAIDRG